MKDLYNKYKEVINYLFFGVCTTVINIVTYYVCAHWFDFSTTVSNIIAWIISVAFAYVTNKIWVFESKEKGVSHIIREMLSFFGCRFGTLWMDIAVMYIFVDVLHYPDMIIKIASNVLVVIVNYIASKLFIFKK